MPIRGRGGVGRGGDPLAPPTKSGPQTVPAARSVLGPHFGKILKLLKVRVPHTGRGMNPMGVVEKRELHGVEKRELHGNDAELLR
jgi:hypothetical protein